MKDGRELVSEIHSWYCEEDGVDGWADKTFAFHMNEIVLFHFEDSVLYCIVFAGFLIYLWFMININLRHNWKLKEGWVNMGEHGWWKHFLLESFFKWNVILVMRECWPSMTQRMQFVFQCQQQSKCMFFFYYYFFYFFFFFIFSWRIILWTRLIYATEFAERLKLRVGAVPVLEIHEAEPQVVSKVAVFCWHQPLSISVKILWL